MTRVTIKTYQNSLPHHDDLQLTTQLYGHNLVVRANLDLRRW